MQRLELLDTEVTEIRQLVGEVAKQYHSVEDTEFLHNAYLYAHQLPRRLRAFLNDFKLLETSGACVVSGYPVDHDKLGPTPAHWKTKIDQDGSPALQEEILLVLYGSLVGDLFGWSTQQAGYIVHDILPIKGHENEQMGTGSEQNLWWHTEDAFHPYKGDYVTLMCLRNPDNIATTVASIEDLHLSPEHVKTLFEPHYTIRPDESHLLKNRPDTSKPVDDGNSLLAAAYDRIVEMNINPPRVPVFFGDPRSPYMSLDPYFMDVDLLEPRPRQALDALCAAIDANLKSVVLKPGDVCFIDNIRAVHGRKPFKARYDGNDRWLKRINITRDIRKSRSDRTSSASRVLF